MTSAVPWPGPDPTLRFSRRAADYARFRPRYPTAVIDVLREEVGLTPSRIVADIGSGTGISTELFLANGNCVRAVEPNGEMRATAERLLRGRPGFRSVDGTAEATGLPPASVDLVVAAQAFHWFDPEKARREFRRILRPEGWVVLLWNRRLPESSPFARDYEAFLDSLEGASAAHRRAHPASDEVGRFFPGAFRERAVPHRQTLDFASLKGALLSASYAPLEGEPGHDAMIAGLARIFEARQADGCVAVDYETRMYCGRLTP